VDGDDSERSSAAQGERERGEARANFKKGRECSSMVALTDEMGRRQQCGPIPMREASSDHQNASNGTGGR
jgi:hypothetical protein